MCEERKEQCTTEEWEVAARERKDEARAAWFTRAKTILYAYARASLRRRPGSLACMGPARDSKFTEAVTGLTF